MLSALRHYILFLKYTISLINLKIFGEIIMRIYIVSLFYNNTNYGGVLQAYALTFAINSKTKNVAKQLNYNHLEEKGTWQHKIKKIFNVKSIVVYVRKKIEKIFTVNKKKYFQQFKEQRKNAFQLFIKEKIPSTLVYEKKMIEKSLVECDIFITGSDQVWNVEYYDDVYRLEFVPPTKYKFSYAAGISSGVLSKEQQEIFRKSLNSFDSISVREKSAVNVLQPLVDKKVEWVLDPTLLLSREDWDNICSVNKIEERYVFCYFLGELSLSNKKIIEFARSKNLKVVSMPYLTWTSKRDSNFGDYKIYDATPPDFISLIKHAEYVFTDSFHATVFSHIYHKNFFVFNRAGLKSMNDRIYSLTSLFDTQERFCDTKEKISLHYIEGLPPIDYSKTFPKFEAMKEKSINFLKENLKRAEEKINGIQ